MTDLPFSRTIRPTGSWRGAADLVTLTYDERFLRRKRLETVQGTAFLVDLAETVSLGHGEAFELSDGTLVEVIAAEEPLLEITGPGLARIAWHIGNRHTPCRIEAARLLIRRDPVLADMLVRLGAHVHLVSEPFVPEGGAYGLGRTMGHDHGPGVQPHQHDLEADAPDAQGHGPHRHDHDH